ncbi:hypothetical protein AGABI1DRAFT_73835 [Agaricus bisporus var. burnettii JB137-S8]|uniref:Uncharacterized protein n=1 Tax=Agaricus bisporus var. burnettii (strain JB137-S8 / ATCC MYA-4627 / FGSC 10392) TaxID=597362 RepID=K5X7Y9_AGABU|nr:uncharacterized protein AGABI1DRAFT_73835 [Agaricus bisporus var. burnettii JB137-S8]EKM79067.1 hypothetical protein AGABI1DRAFT_73835 [Agaricus bisporus var. burnettii JB137-S8]
MPSTPPKPLSPWPLQTPDVDLPPPLPLPTHASPRPAKRRRRDMHSPDQGLQRRQTIADQDAIADAKRQCRLLSGNNVISCWPTADTTVAQHEWTSFIWNSRRPDLTQTNLVDIYLFRADSKEQILHKRDYTNPFMEAGAFPAQVNDTWFGDEGFNWNGQNTSFPYYWVIARSDKGLDGSEQSQSIFSAVQTTYLDVVIASQSAASASASSASVLSSRSVVQASLSSASAAASASNTSSSTSSGSVQSDSSDSGFPHWAIAVITVLGFLAVASICILAFLILRRLRRKHQDEFDSNRNSMGSASPMMPNAAQQGSPLLPTTSLPPPPHSPVGTGSAVAGMGGLAMSERDRNAPSVVMHDGASTTSAGDAPFSGADAAIMADAFRKMLRKPDFAQHLEGDDSPEVAEDDEDDDDEHGGASGAGLIGRELAEEGRDIRSVSSERGVRVETGTIGSDAGSAAIGQRKDTQ